MMQGSFAVSIRLPAEPKKEFVPVFDLELFQHNPGYVKSKLQVDFKKETGFDLQFSKIFV